MDKRMTLKQYLGEIIVVKGIYEGPPTKHEKPVKRDKYGKIINQIEDDKLFTLIPNGVDVSRNLFVPINYASCIKKVQGLNQFEDIKEDHINIQFDISSSKIKKGDIVKIVGRVCMYKKNNIEDYCIDVFNVELYEISV